MNMNLRNPFTEERKATAAAHDLARDLAAPIWASIDNTMDAAYTLIESRMNIVFADIADETERYHAFLVTSQIIDLAMCRIDDVFAGDNNGWDAAFARLDAYADRNGDAYYATE